MDWAQSFVHHTMQCWSCPVFDRMFQVVSEAAANMYPTFVLICTSLFCVILGFYIFGAIWKNITKGFQDGWFDKSLRPVLINALFVVAFLGLGVQLPRFITTVAFEPVAYTTQMYANAMIQTTPDQVDAHIVYVPEEMDDTNGIFSTELRDTIIDTAKVTLTLFQSFISLGVAMMDAALSWDLFMGVNAFIKHVILAFIGFYLFWEFFKMFFRFLCYFADVIIGMAMFAFFFPFSLVAAAFKEADDLPSWLSWIKKLGTGVGIEQIKNLVGAIVSLGVAVITYTVIFVIMAKFFVDPDGSANVYNDLLAAVMDGTIFERDLNQTGLNDLALTSIIVLVYVLGFIYNNIPKVTENILKMFDVSTNNNDAGKEVSDELMKATKGFFSKAGSLTKKVIKSIRS